jgi:GH43 family beta-xylosidase
MKPIHHLSALAALLLASTPLTHAADVKIYQVTGPVLQVTETTVVVQKGDDKWEIAKSKSTKGAAALKVGDKVTIYYRMVADEVEVKSGDAKKSDKKEK